MRILIFFHNFLFLSRLLPRNFNIWYNLIGILTNGLSLDCRRLFLFLFRVIFSLSARMSCHRLHLPRFWLNYLRHVQIAALFVNNFYFVEFINFYTFTDLSQVIVVCIQYFGRSCPRKNNKN
jgi:hypothetical protein